MSRSVRGVPRDIALSLRDKYKLDAFIETGTLIGYSAAWASAHFDCVFTIEVFDDYFKMAVNNLCRLRNVTCIKNLSVYALEQLRLDWDGYYFPLFWLDAHWGEEAQYGRPPQESQVLAEIDNINRWKSPHAILVDDAHKLSTPRWPTRESVMEALSDNGRREIHKAYDVLIATPIKGEQHAAESSDVSATADIP